MPKKFSETQIRVFVKEEKKLEMAKNAFYRYCKDKIKNELEGCIINIS
jgi:hypothetical protein